MKIRDKNGKGCSRISWIDWLLLQLARYFKMLLEKYGD